MLCVTAYTKRYCFAIIAIMVVVLSAAEAVATLSATATKASQQGNKYSALMRHRMGAPRHLHTITRTLSTVRDEIPPLELDAFSSSSQTCDSHAGRCPFVNLGSTLKNAGFAPAIPISGMCGGYYITQDVTPGFVFPVRA